MSQVLQTDRLLVRPLTEDDTDAFHGVWGDPEVIFWGAARDRADTRGRLRRFVDRTVGEPWPVRWHAVLERESRSLVGDVALQPAPFAPGDVEIGWHLRRDRWGRGYAQEAARAVAKEAFARLHVSRLVCVILPENARSARTARALGARVVRRVEHAGLPHDLYELRRDDLTPG